MSRIKAGGLASFRSFPSLDDALLRLLILAEPLEYRLTQPRTVVTLASDGKTVTTTTVYTPEAPLTYSILRNNLYTLGDKTSDQSYGEDTPIRLAEEDVLVMDVNPEWRAFDSIIFQ